MPSIVLFEPDREDADMFFANIFSYWQRKRLCATRVREDARRTSRARALALGPVLLRHGIAIRHDRLADPARDIRTALDDPRPLRPDPRDAECPRIPRASCGTRSISSSGRWRPRADPSPIAMQLSRTPFA